MTQLTIYDFINPENGDIVMKQENDEYKVNNHGFMHVKTTTVYQSKNDLSYSMSAKMIFEITLYKAPVSVRYMIGDINTIHVKYENLHSVEKYNHFITDNPHQHIKTLINIQYGFAVHPEHHE